MIKQSTLDNYFGTSKKKFVLTPPVVVHLKKTESGEIIQDCDIYIGRECTTGGWNLSKSKWANPFKIDNENTRTEVLEKYRQYILGSPELLSSLHELEGKRLGCWCGNYNLYSFLY